MKGARSSRVLRTGGASYRQGVKQRPWHQQKKEGGGEWMNKRSF